MVTIRRAVELADESSYMRIIVDLYQSFSLFDRLIDEHRDKMVVNGIPFIDAIRAHIDYLLLGRKDEGLDLYVVCHEALMGPSSAQYVADLVHDQMLKDMHVLFQTVDPKRIVDVNVRGTDLIVDYLKSSPVIDQLYRKEEEEWGRISIDSDAADKVAL